MKKDCAFQYAVARQFGGITTFQDTDLITLDEAKELWKKWIPDFIEELQKGNSPEIAIWEDMKDNTDYRKHFLYADASVKTDGRSIWSERREYIELPK